MKKILFLSTFVLAIASTSTFAQSSKEKAYGTAFKQEAVITPEKMTVLIADKEKLEDAQLTGYVSKVCKKEGCWMVLRTKKESGDDVMVRMKDHSFTVPKDIEGKTAVVKGTVIKKMQSVAEQKHYLEDAGATADQIAKITAPKPVYEMQVTGVYLD
jgi:hypothetical protein